jgi:hypothetical protein
MTALRRRLEALDHGARRPPLLVRERGTAYDLPNGRTVDRPGLFSYLHRRGIDRIIIDDIPDANPPLACPFFGPSRAYNDDIK